MYSYIKGTLEEISEDQIVVENHGIGYNIRISARMLDVLPTRGEEIKIYTYLYVKEDAFSLFGFPSRDELEMFKLLINVSGIGPKGGLAVLSVLSANDLRYAIVAEDVKTISKAPGVGSKTAKRLIIELKDKIDLEEVIENGFEQVKHPILYPAAITVSEKKPQMHWLPWDTVLQKPQKCFPALKLQKTVMWNVC